jgi:hypothetical protein
VDQYAFNPPPGWPAQPQGWTPPDGWAPDPSWPPARSGWNFWVLAPETAPGPPPVPEVVDATAQPTVAWVDAPLTPIDESVPHHAPLPAPATEPRPFASPDAPPRDARPPGDDHTIEDLQRRIATLEQELQRAQADAGSAPDLVDLDDERVLQEVGIYRYHHPLESADAYRARLRDLQDRIKTAVTSGVAILASDMFTFNNSLAKGRKMTRDFSKLMLRAYNSEADSCVRSLRAGNVVTAKKRLEASIVSIARLGSMMEMRVNSDYHALRIEELELTSDFLMKQQEEREAARDERERLREQRKVEQELAAERERLDKERAHYANALGALQPDASEADRAELQAKIDAIDGAIAHNDYRAANIRAGYVYVISNVGAFGAGVVKIGMTRRLEPHDRISELSGASVPFPFDVHTLFFSDDAVTLETELHRAFAQRKVNYINERKEFFFASPEEVRVVLAEKVGNLLEFTEQPQAIQYNQSKGYWPQADPLPH